MWTDLATSSLVFPVVIQQDFRNRCLLRKLSIWNYFFAESKLPRQSVFGSYHSGISPIDSCFECQRSSPQAQEKTNLFRQCVGHCSQLGLFDPFNVREYAQELHPWKHYSVSWVCALCQKTLAPCFCDILHQSKANLKSYRFRTMGLVALLVIFGFQNFGYQNIPLSMSGELLPVESKVAAMR